VRLAGLGREESRRRGDRAGRGSSPGSASTDSTASTSASPHGALPVDEVRDDTREPDRVLAIVRTTSFRVGDIASRGRVPLILGGWPPVWPAAAGAGLPVHHIVGEGVRDFRT
jgi:hypothetical protein